LASATHWLAPLDGHQEHPLKLIDRYISLEVLRPFVMIIVGVIVIMLSVRLTSDVEMIVVNKVPWPLVLKMIVYKFPEYIVLGLPVAYMIATLLGLARMSKDYELIAIRSTGTGSKRMMMPLLLMALGLSGVAYYLNEEVVPQANKRSQVAQDQAYVSMRSQGAGMVAGDINFKGVDTRFFNVQRVYKQEKRMEGILIFESDPQQPYRIISAANGEWSGTLWQLRQGHVQEYESAKALNFVTREYTFESLQVDTRIRIENYLSGDIKPKEMTSQELKELITATERGGQETRAYEIEYQARFARPLATFFTALIAAPIGLKFARGGYIGFAISIILTFFYFVVDTIGTGIGSLGLISVDIAAWAPNILFGVLGLFFWLQVD
jgi:lipopolysaccharide export system permease protein